MLQVSNDRRDELISSVVKLGGKDKFFKSFTEYFLSSYCSDDISEISVDDAFYFTNSLYKALIKKTVGRFCLNIYNIPHKQDSTFIEIINNDRPFIVDSITNYLASETIKIKRIVNSVMPISRSFGKIKDIGVCAKNSHKNYSVISIEIERIEDKKKLAFLKENLLQTLEYVKASVEDWKLIQGELLKIKAKASILKNIDKDFLDFFDWFFDDNFIMLGFAEYQADNIDDKITFKQIKNSKLGILKINNFDDLLSIKKAAIRCYKNKELSIDITKSTFKSPVHRDVHIDTIRFSFYDEEGSISEEFRIVGLFTSKVFYQKAHDIPIIRNKFDYVISQSGFNKNSHNAKELISILESYPREELFMISAQRLYQITTGVVSVYGRNIVKIYNRIDRYKRFLSVLCFIPKRNFGTGTRQKIQEILAEAYNGKIVGHQTQISDLNLARVHFIIRTDVSKYNSVDYDEIERQILRVTTIWSDSFEQELKEKYSRVKTEEIMEQYGEAFSLPYQSEFSALDAIYDINVIERFSWQSSPIFDFSVEDEQNTLRLKIFAKSSIQLSKMMPVLENFGLNVIHENTFSLLPNTGKNEKIWLHDFKLRNEVPDHSTLNLVKEIIEPAISDCWHGRIENDQLNVLIVTSLLSARDVSLIRAFAKYIRQTSFSYSYSFIVSTLVKNNRISKLLRDYFYSIVGLDQEYKKEEVAVLIQKAMTKLDNVAEDLVFSKFLEIINAIVRTNFFQKNSEAEYKEYISFKLLGEKLENIPLPKPFAEIFVYSPSVEGVHLRGGKVARGGLRWSDRHEDFRTEIHGLVKAQMTKNSVIVPVGSKGGFIVKKNLSGLSRDEFMQAGIESYKTFLRGLLDLTDNIVNDKIVHPNDVVRLDEDDPYLVVAADKGTATFSDIANSVSREYGFWLDDAFASGGSNGYDHKKMGITAKGAWVSVKRHFYELGINIDREEFTVIGIGDMSGDVFGNGMLLSNKIRLIAAFNHMHIFIDPNPDARISFSERKRLFNLPRSSWTDYNKEKISAGGGIFARSAKSIKLSKQAQIALSLEKSEYAPEELIHNILKAPIDLLWNGGIGTYVKAKSESHSDVGDRANDNLRVDASDLQAKVVGEGGNLGFTQESRIEFATLGGYINTDSIDNSAGVDCSDHEVNIKIALQNAVQRKAITQQQRDKLLEEMTSEVEELVLYDNFLQTQAISLARLHGVKSLGQQERLMNRLEREGCLDRKVEFLPDTEEISNRFTEGKGLTRPELSVLLAYSKNYLYQDLLNSNLPSEKYFEKDLLKYFPEILVEKFKKDVFSHKLRSEIISTFVTNSMINRVGITFFYRLTEDTGMKFCDIARAYAIVKDAFDLPSMWKEIESLNNKISANTQLDMFKEINVLIERSTAWLLRNLKQPIKNIETIIADYKPSLESVFTNLDELLSPTAKKNYQNKFKSYTEAGVPKKLASKVASMNAMSSATQIVKISLSSKIDIVDVARTYFTAGTKLQLNYLRNRASSIPTDNYWHKLSIKSYIDSLFDQQMRITEEILFVDAKKKKYCPFKALDLWLAKNQKHIKRYNELMLDIQNYEQPDFAMLNVAGNRIKEVSVTNSA